MRPMRETKTAKKMSLTNILIFISLFSNLTKLFFIVTKVT